MKSKNLSTLFADQIEDVLFAERRVSEALPRMAKAADSPELRQAFQDHLGETREQIHRLEQVTDLIGRGHRGRHAPAILGLIEEAESLAAEYQDSPLIDTALVAAARRVEHYEIASYGTLVTWALDLGIQEAVSLLSESLDEERSADNRLTNVETHAGAFV